MAPLRRWYVRILLVAVAVLALGAIAWGATGRGTADYGTPDGARTSVRPTGVGLPNLGQGGTLGFKEFAPALKAYHDSGAYDRDLATVGTAARRYLDSRLAAQRAPARRRCTTSYRGARVTVLTRHGRRHERLYRRVRRCRKVRPAGRFTGKPAIVLDIDETSLSNYSGLESSGFSSGGLLAPAATGTGTAIAPTLDLYKDARAHGVAVFFVTGRPYQINAVTEANLKRVGYGQGWDGLMNKPSDQGTEAFKASARAGIQKRGYDVVVNMGDQDSDLDGGHADRAFKLPNPFYFIGD